MNMKVGQEKRINKENPSSKEHLEDGAELFFDSTLFIDDSYVLKTFTFEDMQTEIFCSNASSTDHDLTGQIVWPVSIYLSWFLYKNRSSLENKVIVELGAGCGLCGFVASKYGSKIAITDANEIVLDLLEQNAQQNRLSLGSQHEIAIHKLIWGDESSNNDFIQKFTSNVDIILGADVVCWPNLVQPLLTTVKFLLQCSSSPNAAFYCGFVCRASNVQTMLFTKAKSMGFQVEIIPASSFVPDPIPNELRSRRELNLLKFVLSKSTTQQPVVFSSLGQLQTAY